MENVLLIVYLLIVLALIAVILMQRSEGGGLGMGSASANGLVSVRGQANLLTRTTAVLAALFFTTAIGLTILSDVGRGRDSLLQTSADGTTPASVLDALTQMSGGGAALPLPTEATQPAETAPAAETPAGADPITTEADPGLALPVTPAAPADAAADSAPSAPAQ